MYAVNVSEAVYEHGNCDFCKQKEVKVKPLLCKRHFYCRTCNDFSPKFQRGDLHCKICSERWRQRTEEGLKKVDCFLDAETSKGVNKNSDMAIGVDGELISFDTTNKKEGICIKFLIQCNKQSLIHDRLHNALSGLLQK